MSAYHQDPFEFDIAGYDRSEAGAILANLRSLRDQVVTAWRERAVILTSEEQAELQAEIRQTCDFLTDLTRYP